eukprot:387427_1
MISIIMIVIDHIQLFKKQYSILRDTSNSNVSRSITNLIRNDICVCNTSDTKIFNIGFPKSGTLSLHKLLTTMGCHSTHWAWSISQVNYTKINKTNATNSQLVHPRKVGALMELAKRNNKSLLYYFADQINAFAQMDVCTRHTNFWPQLVDYRTLNEQYPNSLFILMHRNITAHIRSIDNWNDMRQSFVRNEIPYLPAGIGEKDDEIRRWIEGHYERITSYFNQVDPERFLKFDIGIDHISKLKRFMHCDNNYTMKHTHKTPEWKKKRPNMNGIKNAQGKGGNKGKGNGRGTEEDVEMMEEGEAKDLKDPKDIEEEEEVVAHQRAKAKDEDIDIYDAPILCE